MDTVTHTLMVGRAMGDGVRLKIMALLRRKTLCVGALAAQVGVTQSAVSQHLRVLRDAGLVASERQGYFTHYRLVETTVEKHMDALRRLLLGSNEDGKQEKGCTGHAHKKGTSRKDSGSCACQSSTHKCRKG